MGFFINSADYLVIITNCVIIIKFKFIFFYGLNVKSDDKSDNFLSSLSAAALTIFSIVNLLD